MNISIIGIRLLIKEIIELIIKGIKVIAIVMFTLITIVIMSILFLFKKLFNEPREFFKDIQKTLQHL